MAKKSTEKLVTRHEFRKLCAYNGKELPYSTLASAIGRKEVILKDRLIDINNPKNAEYIKQKKNQNRRKSDGVVIDMETRKKEMEFRKIQEELRMKEIQRMKLEGEMIEVHLVQQIFGLHYKEVYQQFSYAAGQLSTDLVKKFGGKKKDIAELKASLIAVLNETITKARERSKRQIKDIVDEGTGRIGRAS